MEDKAMTTSRILIIIIIQVALGYFVSPKTIAAEIDAQGLFKKHCVICHGEDGKGKTDFEELGPRDFTDAKWQDSITDEKILEQMANGTPERMFPFRGKLTQGEMEALVPVVRAFGGR